MKDIFFSIVILFSFSAFGQNVKLNLNFECNGSEEKIKKLELSIIDQQDTLIVKTSGNTLEIPRLIFNHQVTLLFSINKKEIVFRNVPIAWNEKSFEWTIGVDSKPFNKEKFWSIKNWEEVKKMIYYLDYGNGKQVIDYK